MDYVTRQFINLAKKFRKELRLYVSRLDSALQKNADAIRSTQEASNQKQSPPPEVTVFNNFPSSIEIHQKAKDARYERNYRRFTFGITVLTLGAIVVYSVLVYRQYLEMIKTTAKTGEAADAAKRAADTAANQLELPERPWVDAQVEIGGPMTFNVNGAIITTNLKLLNSGHSPALSTAVWAVPVDPFIDNPNESQLRKSTCDTAAVMLTGGFSLFPGRPFEQSIGVTIPPGQLAKHVPPHPLDIVNPLVIICIAYKPTFTSKAVYHTSYIMELFRKTDNAGKYSAFFPIGKDVRADHLFFRLYLIKPIEAD
jgi:hypothetical protein